MLDILAHFSIVDDVDEEKECILYAHLASLLDGLEAGHIDSESFSAFCKIMSDGLHWAGIIDDKCIRTGKIVRAEAMWNLFEDAILKTGNQIHSCGREIALADTRDSNSAFRLSSMITVGALSHQLSMIKVGALGLGESRFAHISKVDIVLRTHDPLYLSDLVRCCNYALSVGAVGGNDYLKGHSASITWLTPIENEVKNLFSGLGKTGLDEAEITLLRDLLGLSAQNGITNNPLAVFTIICNNGITAPNAFTARGYERFRHRPPATLAGEPDSGLTYNLSRSTALTCPGMREVVASAVTLPQVQKVVLGGQPRPLYADRNDELAAHKKYAMDVLRGRRISEVVAKLEVFAP